MIPSFGEPYISIREIQRSFTNRITGMQCLEYSDRLVFLKVYSFHRIRERYCIIYVWKIIKGLFPNLSNAIVCTYSERRERSRIVSQVHLGRLGPLAYYSSMWHAICLFSDKPQYIRCMSSCSVFALRNNLTVI